MGKKYQKANAARARQARQQKHTPAVITTAPVFQGTDSNDNGPTDVPKPIVFDFSSTDSECEYTGGVDVNDTSDGEYEESGDSAEMWGSESDSDDSLVELEGEELVKNLQALWVEVEAEIAQLVPTAFECISRPVPVDEWKKVEQNRNLGYNGLSKQTKERRAQQAHAAAKTRQEAKNL